MVKKGIDWVSKKHYNNIKRVAGKVDYRAAPFTGDEQGHSIAAWSALLIGATLITYGVLDVLDNGKLDGSLLRSEEKDAPKEKPIEPVTPEPKINVSGLQNNISGLQQNVSDLKQNVTVLKGNESKLEEKVNQTNENVTNIQENVTELQLQFNYNSFDNAWSDLNTTELRPSEVNRTVRHLKGDIKSYSSLFEQARGTIGTLNDIVNKAEQYNTHVNENISRAQQILSKGTKNLNEKDIMLLEGIAGNLSKSADLATAYNVDLDERYSEELNDLNGILSDLENKEKEIQAYNEDVPIFTENYDSKTSKMQQIITHMKDTWHKQYMNIKNSSVRTIERAAKNYNRNVTQLKNSLSSFTAKDVKYTKVDIDDLERKLEENATAAYRKTTEINDEIEVWYNSGKTIPLDNNTFWQRYNNLSYNQRDAFLNVTIDAVRMRSGDPADDLKTMKLYIPNDPSKKYKATFELVDGSSVTARYSQESFLDVKNIFNYLAFGK